MPSGLSPGWRGEGRDTQGTLYPERASEGRPGGQGLVTPWEEDKANKAEGGAICNLPAWPWGSSTACPHPPLPHHLPPRLTL